MSIIYREAVASDSQKLLEYLQKVGCETDYLSFGAEGFRISVEQEARFIERFRKNSKDIMLIALDGDEIVANASIECNRIKRYSHRAELSVTVLRDYWRKGIGSTLVNAMIDFARNVGIEVIYLDVRADNERAIALYRKFGFDSIGIFKNYFNINNKFYDAIFMQLLL